MDAVCGGPSGHGTSPGLHQWFGCGFCQLLQFQFEVCWRCFMHSGIYPKVNVNITIVLGGLFKVVMFGCCVCEQPRTITRPRLGTYDRMTGFFALCICPIGDYLPPNTLYSPQYHALRSPLCQWHRLVPLRLLCLGASHTCTLLIEVFVLKMVFSYCYFKWLLFNWTTVMSPCPDKIT